MENNQKKLYYHYKKLAVDGATDSIRLNAKKRAEGLLKDYPQFESKIELGKEIIKKVGKAANSKGV